MSEKVIVAGLDGADWSIINKLLREGKLPNLRKIMNEGSYGKLKSTFPTQSPSAWTSFITGKNPGKHGIFDFLKFDKDKNKVDITTSNDRRSPGMWHFLKNKRSIVINVPLTYPPEKINGIMISGLPSPEEGPDYCSPKDIYFELKNEFENDFKIQPSIYYHESGGNFVKDEYRCWRNNEKVFWYLKNNKKWDLLVCVFHVFDELSHELWKYIDENHPNHEKSPLGKYIFKMYEKADYFLGKLLDEMDEDTNLFIMSDHGFGPVYKTIYLNNWLIKKGWLKLRKSKKVKIKKKLHFSGFNIYNILILLRKLGIDILNKAFKSTFRSSSKSLLEKLRDFFFLSTGDVDWKNSKAFSMGGFGQIYIKKENVKDYKDFLEKIKRGMKKLRDPEIGKKIFDRVLTKDEIYKGKAKEKAPDLIFYDKPMRYLPVKMFEFGSNKLATPQALGRSGSHKLYGVFFAYGKNIKSVSKKLSLNIKDLAPTILHLLGEKIPKSIDGSLIRKIIPDKFLEENSPEYFNERGKTKTKESIKKSHKDKIKDRLKSLGYI